MVTSAREKEAASKDESIKARYDDVRARIAAAAARGGRSADDVILVVVTKNASMEQIREMIALGHVDFGESRTQTLVQHAAQVDDFLQRLRELHGVGKRHGASHVADNRERHTGRCRDDKPRWKRSNFAADDQPLVRAPNG